MDVRPGNKRTDVGVIPEDWNEIEYTCIGDIIDGDRGVNYPGAGDFQDSGHCLFLNAGNVTKTGFQFDDCQFISADRDEKLNKGKLSRQDVVLTTRGTLGNLAYFSEKVPYDHIRINSGMVIMRSTSSTVDHAYHYFVLRSRIVGSQIERLSFGSAQPQLTVKGIETLKIPLPRTKAEQEAIAKALSDADAHIESLEQLLHKKRQIKKGVMQVLLTGKTRLPGFSGEWRTVRSGDLGRFQGGNGFPTKFQGATTGDYPFFKVSDMNNKGNETFMARGNNYISEKVRKQLGTRAFPANSIVFAKVGAAVFLERKRILAERSCLDNNMAAFVLNDDAADYRFLHYVLVNTNLGDLVSTTALPSLSGSVLAAIVFRVPPIAEQTAIATIFSDMDAEITALETKLSKAHLIKQGMMQELLTGRIRLL